MFLRVRCLSQGVPERAPELMLVHGEENIRVQRERHTQAYAAVQLRARLCQYIFNFLQTMWEEIDESEKLLYIPNHVIFGTFVWFWALFNQTICHPRACVESSMEVRPFSPKMGASSVSENGCTLTIECT